MQPWPTKKGAVNKIKKRRKPEIVLDFRHLDGVLVSG
jgi:hypothetical protein